MVMEDHRHAVGRQLDVAFYGEAGFGGAREGRQGIFPDGPVHVVVAAMGDGEVFDPGCGCHASISMMASISTAALRGSAAMPTAARACFPASPRMSATRLEAPLITRCCSVKPGAEATKPLSLRMRRMRP